MYRALTIAALPLTSPILMGLEFYSRREPKSINLNFYSNLTHDLIGSAFIAQYISGIGGALIGIALLASCLSTRSQRKEQTADILLGLLPKAACSLAIGAWAQHALRRIPASGWLAGLANMGLGIYVAKHAFNQMEK